MVFFLSQRAGMIEKEKSTVSFALSFFWQTFLIQTTYLLLAFAIGLLYGPALETYSAGIWPVYLWMITFDSVRNPNQGQSLCCLPI